VTSISSTLYHLHTAFEGEGAKVTAPLLGPREMEKWAVAVDRSKAVRDRHHDQILDVQHAEFHATPMRVIERIYDRFGLKLTAQVEATMLQRTREKPEMSHGAHLYDMASFGLRREEIVERYRDYIEEFGFALK
jgi:hypothetical protein